MTAYDSKCEQIVTQFEDGILQIRMNRPEKKNALNLDMYSAMVEALERGEEDKDVRVILFTGTGDCFSSGNDVLDFMNAPPSGDDSPAVRFIIDIAQAKKPLVAAVNGLAIGIGVTMLMHCELTFASERARFRMPFVNLGLCPEAGSSLILPLLAGYQRASELLLLGEFFDAQTAQDVGLVNTLCPADELLDTAMARARQLAAQPAASVRLAKRLMKQALLGNLRETMEDEGKSFFQRLHEPEFAEAVQAMFQKRKPDFSSFD